MLRQKIQQKLLQKLSPQQIQLIKLLEVPTLQLEQRIKREIEENPTLEEGNDDEAANEDYETNEEENQEQETEAEEQIDDDFSLDDYIEDEELPTYKTNSNNYSKDEDDKKEIPVSSGISLHEHLNNQLGLQPFEGEDIVLAEYIIGNIDDDGYLRRDLPSIVNDIAFSQNIMASEKRLQEILSVIQTFDPPGIGARSLQECLLIQVKRKLREHPDDEYLKLARDIISHHFTELTKKHYDKIVNRMNISNEELKATLDEILQLNPKPGSSFGETSSNVQQIIPDFILEYRNNELHLSLNSRNSPELRINQYYKNMLESYNENKKNRTRKQKEAIMFVKQKLDAAKWFIDAIKQRQNTLLLTMQAIIDYQREYFLEGDERKLKPMILKDIAERTGLDISTISRVANSKYIQTHFGIFPLKYFFSEGMQKNDGEEVSTREIKSILQESIDNEDKKKPLTDEKLAQILQKEGYQIARRTVAKYREQLNIPVARLRKDI